MDVEKRRIERRDNDEETRKKCSVNLVKILQKTKHNGGKA